MKRSQPKPTHLHLLVWSGERGHSLSTPEPVGESETALRRPRDLTRNQYRTDCAKWHKPTLPLQSSVGEKEWSSLRVGGLVSYKIKPAALRAAPRCPVTDLRQPHAVGQRHRISDWATRRGSKPHRYRLTAGRVPAVPPRCDRYRAAAAPLPRRGDLRATLRARAEDRSQLRGVLKPCLHVDAEQEHINTRLVITPPSRQRAAPGTGNPQMPLPPLVSHRCLGNARQSTGYVERQAGQLRVLHGLSELRLLAATTKEVAR